MYTSTYAGTCIQVARHWFLQQLKCVQVYGNQLNHCLRLFIYKSTPIHTTPPKSVDSSQLLVDYYYYIIVASRGMPECSAITKAPVYKYWFIHLQCSLVPRCYTPSGDRKGLVSPLAWFLLCSVCWQCRAKLGYGQSSYLAVCATGNLIGQHNNYCVAYTCIRKIYTNAN